MGQSNFLWMGVVIAISALIVWLLQDVMPFWMLSIILLLFGAAVGNLQRRTRKDT
ncbi:hypothetical protein ACNOIU_03430 [Exiguobacterium mexicanum]|uniref:Uncharacterized protein n=1 Tax=Exiguobacterium mexicanum TaxID=340146 RepID=A0ABT7MMM4_9BACL|nr:MULTISPECIES: hypothetical protein [Exiguobacterium]MDL5376439.1 hypothetical protein [Exiguobacterium mexicanum]